MSETVMPSDEMNSDWKFNSLVCFDLETTGLPAYGPVKITELALTGVVRAHIVPQSLNILPRITHKLSFSVNPEKVVSLDSSLITGLWNDILVDVKPLDKNSFNMVLAFLNTLPPPVCLIAHNGFKFDFPILKQQLRQLQESLPDHVICIDSLPAFKKILGEDVKQSSSLIQRMVEDMKTGNDVLMRVAEELEEKSDGIFPTKHPDVTPNRKTVAVNVSNKKNKCPEGSTGEGLRNQNKSKVRRNLFPAEPPISYKLCDIYNHLFGHPPEAVHTAEEDAIALLKCIVAVAPKFLKYANENFKTFSSI